MAGSGAGAGAPDIVPLPAEIDITNYTAAAAMLLGAVDNASGLLIADMTGTTFCDSSGMRMLLAAHDRAAANGSTLRVVIRPGSAVSRGLAILGIDRVLSLYATVEEARAGHPATRLPMT